MTVISIKVNIVKLRYQKLADNNLYHTIGLLFANNRLFIEAAGQVCTKTQSLRMQLG